MKTHKYLLVISILLFQYSKGFTQIPLTSFNRDMSEVPSRAKPTSFHSTLIEFNASSKYLALAFTAYGLLALENDPLKHINSEFQEEILEHHANFNTRADNYLQFSPALTTFSLKFAGLEGENDTFNSIKIYATSTLLMAGTVYALKSTTKVLRPDGSARTSFPSGHTATAFAGAEFMHQEFKNTLPVLSYSGYLVATATGTLRMYNNKHYLSDVVAGAGIGILTTKAAYWLNSKLFKSKGVH